MVAVESKCREIVLEETIVFETDLQVGLMAIILVHR
jgi:hypothetical protein